MLEQHGGDLNAMVAAIRAGVDDLEDPFELLPTGESAPPPA